jgi:hypothetical protein
LLQSRSYCAYCSVVHRLKKQRCVNSSMRLSFETSIGMRSGNVGLTIPYYTVRQIRYGERDRSSNRNGRRSSNNSDKLLLRVALPNPHT